MTWSVILDYQALVHMLCTYGAMRTGCGFSLDTSPACTLQALRLGTLYAYKRTLLRRNRLADSMCRVACSSLHNDMRGLRDVAR
jgi:hypothetical protein